MRTDVYEKITSQIVAELEKGVRPWHQPWNAAHMEGRVALPLRHNGVAYRGVNVLALWMEATAMGYAAPIWMTFKQALARILGARQRRRRGGRLSLSPPRRVDQGRGSGLPGFGGMRPPLPEGFGGMSVEARAAFLA